MTPSEDNVFTDGEIEVVLPKNLKIYGGIGNNSIEGGAKDNNALLAFQLMEKMTGTHVEWTHPAQGAIDEQFNLLIASVEYPKGFPLTGVGFDGFFVIGKLLWSFGTTYDFHLGDDGKVVYGPMTDDFVEGLTFIRKLYEEG